MERKKNNVGFFLQKLYNSKSNEYSIRMAVSFGQWKQVVNVGVKISPKKWEKDTQRCKSGVVNSRGDSASKINSILSEYETLANDVLRDMLKSGESTQESFKAAFDKAIGKEHLHTAKAMTVSQAFIKFLTDCNKSKSWENSTLEKYTSFGRVLNDFAKDKPIESFNSGMLRKYHDFLVERGLSNVTIRKKFSTLKTFLSWCTEKKIINNALDWSEYKPTIKTVKSNDIIFLDIEELKAIQNLEFDEYQKHLERVRDCFLFQCVTGLRYSDLEQLKKNDIRNDVITVVTEKTDKMVQIPLNEISRNILAKYSGIKGMFALPVPSNQRMNEYLKNVCMLAEIDTPIKKTYYIGTERKESIYPKWQIVGTHAARRTFVCWALSLGISPAVIMRWTGHATIREMQPYIDACNTDRIREIQKLSL